MLAPLLLFVSASSPLLADWATERKAYVEAFRSRDAGNRVEAVRALREFDNPDAARLLLGQFSAEKDDGVLAELAARLCDIADPDAREALSKGVLGESDGGRRAKFCRIFAGGRGLDRVEILKKLLADRDPAVRGAAAGTLGAPDGLLTRFVATLATDPVPAVRRQGIEALGRIATVEAVEPLIVCLENEKDADLQAAAIAALKRLTDRDYGANPEAWRAWWRKHRAKDLTQVDRAITSGADYLRAQLKRALSNGPPDPKNRWAGFQDLRAIPVMTYALIHACPDRSDPLLKAGVEYIATKDPDGTYNAALMALALADLDAHRYRARLAELAQILCDQQCVNGQWSYGGATGQTRTPPRVPDAPPPDEASGPGDAKKQPKSRIEIRWSNGPRPAAGDNSNTQFAILGLRAATEAGCEIPKQVWQRSLDWYIKAQEQPYGGWGYGAGSAYWAMTCSGTCSVTICLRALGKDDGFRDGRPLDVQLVRNGVDWLDNNWAQLTARMAMKGGGGWGFYYDMYSLERVGMIVGIEKIGEHDWYAEGSGKLLEVQETDGSWGGNGIDTAFAILFLRRATRGYEVSPQDK